MIGVPRTIEQALIDQLVRELGFFWAVCPFCPKRALCNPSFSPPICPWCRVALKPVAPAPGVN